MNIGVILPTFTEEADLPIQMALWAEKAELDGVFVYDHIWPIGYPGRPAVSAVAVLGILTQTTKYIRLGTLVARVGLLPDNLLISQMKTLNCLSGNRMIAGMGTGDKKSAPENKVLHIPEKSVIQRQEALKNIAATLLNSGVTTWIGAGLDSTNRIAVQTGAKLNFWNISPDALKEKIFSGCWDKSLSEHLVEITKHSYPEETSVVLADKSLKAENFTWAGRLPHDNTERVSLYNSLRNLGISWTVFYLDSNKKKELQKAVSALARLKNGLLC